MPFTPGPWTLQECPSGRQLLIRAGGDWKKHPQTHLQILPDADARLIALAPEMFKKLKQLAELGCGLCSCELRDEALTLIEQIEGEK